MTMGRPVVPLDDPGSYCIELGVVQADRFTVVIERGVFQRIHDFSKTGSREVGCLLLGTVWSRLQRVHVPIEDHLEVPSVGQSFRLTGETWNAAVEAATERWPEKLIVGWHHTHPGYGIFLSGMDLSIHKEFFRSPWSVALVTDPNAEDMGFFQWNQDQIGPCGFWWLRRRTS
jgi:proteasome lid subunit RPN8/RPN11